MACKHPRAATVHRFKKSADGRSLSRQPSHKWCSDCQTALTLDGKPMAATESSASKLLN